MTGDRRAPVRGDAHYLHLRGRESLRPSGTISWQEHQEAWAAYAMQFPDSVQVALDHVRVAELGGFGHDELERYLGREPLTFVPEPPPAAT